MVTTTANLTGIAAEIDYVSSQTDIAYVNAKTDIFLNYNTKNRNFADSATANQVTAFTVITNKTDSAVAIDTPSIHNSRLFTDSVITGDSVVVSQGFGRSFVESIPIKDTYDKENENGSVLNTVVFNSEPLLSTSRTLSNIIVTLGKNNSDSITATAVPTIIQAVGRSPTDSTTSSDAISAGLNKAFADSVTMSDIPAIHETYNYGITPSVTVTDVATLSFMSGFTLNGNTAILNVNPIN